MPIDLAANPVDLLAFTGHKSLLGPTGTGGLVIADDIELRPLIFGGTGSESEHEFQPAFLPDQLESGTINSVGIAGLVASTQFLLETSVEQIRCHEQMLVCSPARRTHCHQRRHALWPAGCDQSLPALSPSIWAKDRRPKLG